MSWTIPDDGTADNTLQSLLFSEYLKILIDGYANTSVVLAGGGVTGNANMTLAIAKATYLQNRTLLGSVAANVTITAADATNPRIDLIVFTTGQVLAVRAGTPAANPKPPARTSGDVGLWAVWVPANDTVIAATQCVDLRMPPSSPVMIYRTTTQEVTNTAANAHLLNKAGQGVAIPDGMFLAGGILRIQIGGNMLLNSGVGTTNALQISFGSSVMFNQVETVAQVASANRVAFNLDFCIVAQSNTVQKLIGLCSFGDFTITRVNPATGVGNLFQNTSTFEQPPALNGSGAASTDAGGNAIQVLWTFATNNVANEVVVDCATVEFFPP